MSTSENIEAALSCGKQWLEMFEAISSQSKSRMQLVEDFRFLRSRLAAVYDRYALEMTFKESRTIDPTKRRQEMASVGIPKELLKKKDESDCDDE